MNSAFLIRLLHRYGPFRGVKDVSIHSTSFFIPIGNVNFTHSVIFILLFLFLKSNVTERKGQTDLPSTTNTHSGWGWARPEPGAGMPSGSSI